MKKSIFYKLVYICIITLVISGAVGAYILHATFENAEIDDMTQILQTASTASDSKDAKYISSITGNERITIIDSDGNVLSDSHVRSAAENHKMRPEVSSAIANQIGVSKRTSSTTGQDMLYVAINNEGTIYRIAIERSGVDKSFLKLMPAILAGIPLAVIVAIILAGGISNSLISPLMSINDNLSHINDKDYEKVNFKKSKYEEINKITGAIDYLIGDLSGYIEYVSKQHDKMDFILNNMGQGMILVDNRMDIILCNRFAALLFKQDAPAQGQLIADYTENDKIAKGTMDCIKSGTSRMFDVDIENNTYAVTINPVNTSWLEGGAFILLTDVSEIRSRQKLRQEFVNGVVHDLRNPIASIGDNADVLRRGMIKGEEHQREFLQEIADEAKHMQEVIDDLLILSVLDEAKEVEDCHPIHAYDICMNVQEKLIPMSKKMKLSMQINGDKNTLIRMKSEHFEKVMNEFMTNAIKYNEDGGSVTVNLEQIGDKAKISVSNTGPGLDAILVPRLFERFYREEQNRNANIQGAGLGLSIIKHIISLYDGSISVKLDPEKGNTFTIIV